MSLNGHEQGPSPAQRKLDAFWESFTTKNPGKVTTILPKNVLAERLAKRSAAKDLAGGKSKMASASFEEAAALCRAKVDKIVAECRRTNQKYCDPHFDLEYDLRSGRRDCLESLSNKARPAPPGPPDGGDGGIPVFGLSAEDEDRPGANLLPKSVKRVGEIFDDPVFFIDGVTANDVRQGRDGDCWFMAALCTLSNKPGLIERICVARDERVGVYGFVFHRDGEWISEIIDDKLYLIKADYDQSRVGFEGNRERELWDDIMHRPDAEEHYRRTYQANSTALYFAQCENPNETWLPLLEKAYAKAHGDYAAIEGGWTGEGIEDLTGGVTTPLCSTDILDKEYFWKEELMKVNEDFLFGCSTDGWDLGYGSRNGIVENHAYSVMRAVEMDGERLVLLKNPWGTSEWTGPWSDGSKEWTPEWLQKLGHRFGDDGAFWISYKDLLRKYQAFDRTRLFGPEWKVTSMWTSLNVPWNLEYHDTKFAFTLARPGPVVVVLSQLDDRYFRGLEGEYSFDLGFRVHRAGEEDYLVRASTAYDVTRSCNVELELEPGEYTVLVKIVAHRSAQRVPAEEVVRRSAPTRREKLLRIGLAYDLAHSKARAVVETPEEKAEREAYEKRRRARRLEKLRRKVMKERKAEYERERRAVEKRRKEHRRRMEREKRKAAKEEARRQARQKEEEARQDEADRPDDGGNGNAGSPAREAEPEAAKENPAAGDAKGADEKQENGVESKAEAGNGAEQPDPKDKGSVGENPSASAAAAPPAAQENASEAPPKQEDVPVEALQESTPNGASKGAPTLEKTAPDASDGPNPGDEHPRARPRSHSRGRPSPDDDEDDFDFDDHSSLCSPRSVSTVSTAELNDMLDDEDGWRRRRRMRSSSPSPGPPSPPPPMAADGDADPGGPWNAVAVVGLRIYYKVAEADRDAEGLVKLRVVRPRYYELSDEDESSDDEEEEEEEMGGDGEKKKEEKEEATDESKVLDVDDSAKDATLETPMMESGPTGQASAEAAKKG